MPLRMRKSGVPATELCPIGAGMTLIGGAWTPNVIWYLSGGPRRFSELRADMKPISAKVLSARLKELEEKGVVTRRVVDTSPPSVEYSLTALGLDLVPAIRSIAQVGYKLKLERSSDGAGSARRTNVRPTRPKL